MSGDWGRLHRTVVHYVLPGPFPRKACDRVMAEGDRMTPEFAQVTCLRCRHYPPVLIAEGRPRLKIAYEQRANGRVEGPLEDPAVAGDTADHFVPGHVLARAGEMEWDECVVLYDNGVVGIETDSHGRYYSREEARRLGEYLVRASRERVLASGEGRVHVLWRGVPICGFSRDVPAMWPPGHRWEYRHELANVTCKACLLEVPNLPPENQRSEPEVDCDA